MALRRRHDAYDAEVKDTSSIDEVAAYIAEALWVKGYAFIDAGKNPRTVAAAVDEAKELDPSRFKKPPEIIVDGLLGAEGTGKYFDLLGEDENGGKSKEWGFLRELDEGMTQFLEALAVHFDWLDIKAGSRTLGMLHETASEEADEGGESQEPPALSEMDGAEWLSVFAHHTLMVIFALGPEQGRLELQPFDEESNSTRVVMPPGSLVILRADALAHRFSAARRSYCLTTFLVRDPSTSKRKQDYGGALTPTAALLEDWASNRIREIKEMDEDMQRAIQIPRHWQSIMNQSHFTGQRHCVRTCAIKMPTSYKEREMQSYMYIGPDFTSEVPQLRWEHSWVYDPNPESWKVGKTDCKHMAFIDGQELFDASLFRISRSEAAGMDPGHRMTLETGYEALIKDGMKISTMMNSRGGVYVANPSSMEWGMAEKSCTSSGVCGGGGSIACGRFSFTHGLKGPCISLDTEACSSLSVVNYACNGLTKAGKWEPIPYALCSSWHLVLVAHIWIHMTAQGLLAANGRCFSFDASAHGYVRGEAVNSLVMRAETEEIDGVTVRKEGGQYIGSVVGCHTNQSGKRAHITAPDGESEQVCLAEAIEEALISPLDIDAIECSTNSRIIDDALEASVIARALRPEGERGVQDTPPISLQSLKQCLCNQVECVGLTQILNNMLAAQVGSMYPFLHLRLLNPYTDISECDWPEIIATEPLEFKLASNYAAVKNRSIGGTNGVCITWGQIKEQMYEHMQTPAPINRREKMIFWPEGGGDLAVQSSGGYSIAGSFSNWELLDMKRETDGYSFKMTLGESRRERFQIYLDGRLDKVLHPEDPKVGKNSTVLGPEECTRALCWYIDGRGDTSVPAIAEGGEAESALSPGEWQDGDNEDCGVIGDQYRIQLHISGKWQSVGWEKLPGNSKSEIRKSEYQIVGSWTDGASEPMVEDTKTGTWTFEVVLPAGGTWFQIMRNGDWGQIIYPADSTDDPAFQTICGPDDEAFGRGWLIRGQIGDLYRIELANTEEGIPDNMRVHYERTARARTPSPAYVEAVQRDNYYVLGTWNGMADQHKMHWQGLYYQLFLEMGENAEESFYIMRDGACFSPSTQNANPFEAHTVEYGLGTYWTVGHHPRDTKEPYTRWEIKVMVEGGAPVKVEWVKLERGLDLEEARGRGYMVLAWLYQ